MIKNAMTESTVSKTKYIECRFNDIGSFYSETEGLPKVLNDFLETTSDKFCVSQTVMNGVLEYEKSKIVCQDTNEHYQSLSHNARVNISISLDREYANAIGFAESIIKIECLHEMLDEKEIIALVASLIKFIKDSVHINKGHDRCIAYILVQLCKENKDKLVSVDDILHYYKDEKSKNTEGSCPFNSICNGFFEKNHQCMFSDNSNDESINIITNTLHNLEIHHVIKSSKSNGELKYAIAPLINK